MRLVLMISALVTIGGCAPPGHFYEHGSFVSRPRDACALPAIAAEFINLLNQKVSQPGGPPNPVISVQQIASPGFVVEQRSQLRSCRAVLAFDNGQTASGMLTITDAVSGVIRQVTWEPDSAVEKQAADQRRADIEAKRIVESFRVEQAEHGGTKIEKGAILYDDSKASRVFAEKLARLVKENGLACKTISAARPMITAVGYVLVCNEFSYTYDIQDKGGRWTVVVR